MQAVHRKNEARRAFSNVAQRFNAGRIGRTIPVPEGRANLPEDMFRVISDPVLYEQRQEFGFERMRPVVLRLRIHVPDDRIDLRLAYTERRVSFLPRKTTAPDFVHPLRGDALQRLDRLGQGHDRREREQHVRVIRHAADSQDVYGPVPSDLCHVSP